MRSVGHQEFDDRTAFSPQNNFLYLPGQEPRLPHGNQGYVEYPARVTGNGVFRAEPFDPIPTCCASPKTTTSNAMPEHQKWMNDCAFDGGLLSDGQRQLREAYAAVLCRVREDGLVREGEGRGGSTPQVGRFSASVRSRVATTESSD